MQQQDHTDELFARKKSGDEVERLSRQLEESESKRRQALAEIRHKDLKIERLTARLAKRTHTAKKLVAWLNELQLGIEKLYGTTRWKLVNAERVIYSKFHPTPWVGYNHVDKVIKAFAKWRETASGFLSEVAADVPYHQWWLKNRPS